LEADKPGVGSGNRRFFSYFCMEAVIYGGHVADKIATTFILKYKSVIISRFLLAP